MAPLTAFSYNCSVMKISIITKFESNDAVAHGDQRPSPPLGLPACGFVWVFFWWEEKGFTRTKASFL